jgi:DNA-binding FadR family transcriptional regulator
VVASAIRRQITSGELREGDRLPAQAQLGEAFAVSRPTLREAFRILESEKLISVSRGSRGGAQVHQPQADHLARYAKFVLQSRKASYRDVYQSRILIEPPAARFVAEHHADEVPDALRQVIRDGGEAVLAGDLALAVATFHTRLVQLTGNQTLILISSMLDEIIAHNQSQVAHARRRSRTYSATQSEAGLRSQEKLVVLIEERDGLGAETHWRTHMENAAKVWLGHGAADAIVDWED